MGALAGLWLVGCGDDVGGSGSGGGATDGAGGSSSAESSTGSGGASAEVQAAVEAFCEAGCACGTCSDQDRADCVEAYLGYELAGEAQCDAAYVGAFACAADRQAACGEEPVTSLETCEADLAAACDG